MRHLLCGVAATTALLAGHASAEDARHIVVLRGSQDIAATKAAIERAGGRVEISLEQVGVLIVSGDEKLAKRAKRMRGVDAFGAEPVFATPEGDLGDVVAFGDLADVVAFDLGDVVAFGDLNDVVAFGDLGDVVAFGRPNGSDLSDVVAFGAPTEADALLTRLGLLWGIDRVGAPDAWARGHTGKGVTVAVVDSGVAWNHPDLRGRVTYAACVSADGVPCNPYPTSSTHGTHVAGTIAASFDAGLAVGVAPEASIASYNVFPGADATTSFGQWAYAVLDAADRGYDVINLSLGSLHTRGGKGTAELNAFLKVADRVTRYAEDRGAVIVASAGNHGVRTNGRRIVAPAGLRSVLTVGAASLRGSYQMDGAARDAATSYTNYGQRIDISAPGGDCGTDLGFTACRTDELGYPGIYHAVLSTTVSLPRASDHDVPACAATYSCPVGYGWQFGTSMAAPHASGTAALVRQAAPDLAAAKVRRVVKRTSDGRVTRQIPGRGVVDAAAATADVE